MHDITSNFKRRFFSSSRNPQLYLPMVRNSCPRNKHPELRGKWIYFPLNSKRIENVVINLIKIIVIHQGGIRQIQHLQIRVQEQMYQGVPWNFRARHNQELELREKRDDVVCKIIVHRADELELNKVLAMSTDSSDHVSRIIRAWEG